MRGVRVGVTKFKLSHFNPAGEKRGEGRERRLAWREEARRASRGNFVGPLVKFRR